MRKAATMLRMTMGDGSRDTPLDMRLNDHNLRLSGTSPSRKKAMDSRRGFFNKPVIRLDILPDRNRDLTNNRAKINGYSIKNVRSQRGE
jgi:hypothetical protein